MIVSHEMELAMQKDLVEALNQELDIRGMVSAYFAEICKNRDLVILVLHLEYSAYFQNIS